MLPCPCDTGLAYEACCGPYHAGHSIPADALALMRSRYSAVARQLPAYLVQTTHRKNPSYDPNVKRWVASWQQYCQQTACRSLTIVAFEPGETEALVHFVADLQQGDKLFQLEEKSRFVKLNKRWLYLDGELL